MAFQIMSFVTPYGIGLDLFVPKIPSYTILDLAKAVAPQCKINFIGSRAGEKIHEDYFASTGGVVMPKLKIRI